jgi:hypothetical protein
MLVLSYTHRINPIGYNHRINPIGYTHRINPIGYTLGNTQSSHVALYEY